MHHVIAAVCKRLKVGSRIRVSQLSNGHEPNKVEIGAVRENVVDQFRRFFGGDAALRLLRGGVDLGEGG